MAAWISVKCWKGSDRRCHFHLYRKETMRECLIIEIVGFMAHNAPKWLKFSEERSIFFIKYPLECKCRLSSLDCRNWCHYNGMWRGDLPIFNVNCSSKALSSMNLIKQFKNKWIVRISFCMWTVFPNDKLGIKTFQWN